VEAAFAAPFPEGAARLVIPVGALVAGALCEQAARAAARAGRPVEWSLRGRIDEIPALVDRALAASAAGGLEALLVSVDCPLPVHAVRLAAARLRERGAADVPLVLRHRRRPGEADEESLLRAAVELGAPLCDGLGDAVALAGFADPGHALALAYRILQGARLRTSWTEYISCPSCGRTLFDLEETTARIKERTRHLRGVKIAVMGCIVNGPGEMADADFGYVGSGPGLVDLYVGKQVVARKIPEREAPDRLLALIGDGPLPG
jgi:(E)-4-hydroxy-3-methylbut-2-enyl-diphosphate synthase